MALIVDANKALDVIKLINDGKDSEAVDMLGLTCATQPSNSETPILRKVCEVAAKSDKSAHSGGILVSPEDKMIQSRDIVNQALELSYMLTESTSMIAANAMTTMSSLLEGDNPILNEKHYKALREEVTTGLVVAKDALIDLFANTAKLHMKTRDAVKNCLDENGSSKTLYVSLAGNAVTAAGMIYAVAKLNDFKGKNDDNIQEAIMTANIDTRCDDVLFAVLGLQENLIETYKKLSTFIGDFAGVMENEEFEFGSTEDPIVSASGFIKTAIDSYATDFVNESLSNSELNDAFNMALASIGALYDEYLQDLCEVTDGESTSNDDENPTDTEEPAPDTESEM